MAMTEIGTTFRLSYYASDVVAAQLVDAGWFGTRQDAAMFAAAYALKYHFDDFDPGTFIPEQNGTTYAYYNVDVGGQWETLIKNLYKTETPKLYFRNLMIFGLETIGHDIESKGVIQIQNYV